MHSFLKHQYLYLFIMFLVLICIFPIHGKIDMSLIQLGIGDHARFYLRDNWFFAQFAHQDIKYILIASYVMMFWTWISSFRNNNVEIKQHARSYGIFVLVAMVSVTVVGLFKSQSSFMCPWDAISASNSSTNKLGYYWMLTKQAGHCFPGGHSSLGFSLITGYFIFYNKNRNLAVFYLMSGIILGMSMGWTQMLRGAHFFSHNLWSAWFVWATNVVAYPIYQMKKIALVESSETLN